jgi:peptidyl-prolyl cis-trans isomerase B (cyclophilin B)
MKAKLLFIPLFLALIALSACEKNETDTYSYSNDLTTNEQTMKKAETKPVMQMAAPAAGEKIAVLETDLGTIKMKLFTQQVPEMTKNFEQLASAGKYKDVPFHRVVNNFVIQTGDFTNKNGTGGHSYKGEGTKLPDEIIPGLSHLYGTVAMANAGPDTNGSQFYIVVDRKGTAFLDGNYTIFGQVYEGMDVADQIAALEIPGTQQPNREVNLKNVTVDIYNPAS